MYHKLFAQLLVCFWRELSYGVELFLHKKSTTLPLVYPLTASHTCPGALSKHFHRQLPVDGGEDIEKTSYASLGFQVVCEHHKCTDPLALVLGQAVHNSIHLVNRRTSHLSVAKSN